MKNTYKYLESLCEKTIKVKDKTKAVLWDMANAEEFVKKAGALHVLNIDLARMEQMLKNSSGLDHDYYGRCIEVQKNRIMLQKERCLKMQTAFLKSRNLEMDADNAFELIFNLFTLHGCSIDECKVYFSEIKN